MKIILILVVKELMNTPNVIKIQNFGRFLIMYQNITSSIPKINKNLHIFVLYKIKKT